MFTSIIIGDGEIGKSLQKVIGGEIVGKTKKQGQYDIIHICFPFFEGFVEEVKRYQKLFNPKYTVIHSTVPIGTSRKCDAIHSPVVGIHPYLEESLKTFVKFLGGEKSGEVADYFRKHNMKVYITDKQESTELIKLLCTTKVGVDVEYTKDVKRQCDKYEVPFELWTIWSDNYNKGYSKIGQEQFSRPNLVPMMKPIGGHCIMPNAKLIDTIFTRLLSRLNK